MIGPIVDSSALAVGGLAGVFFGRWLPERVKETLPLIFGVITISLGTALVGKAHHFPVVVLALIVGSFIGELAYAEKLLERVVRKSVALSRSRHVGDSHFVINVITLISALCFGSMGIFGSINEGVTGVPDILLTKSVLDLFTGMIFGASLGLIVSMIAIPQFCILALLYMCAGAIMPCMTEGMMNDFSSCGGVIFLATGLRMCGIKIFPVINMLPSLFFVLPLSYAWETFFM